jgi:hypothetical protein
MTLLEKLLTVFRGRPMVETKGPQKIAPLHSEEAQAAIRDFRQAATEREARADPKKP